MHKTYSDSDISFLRKYYPIHGASFCSIKLNRPVVSIHRICSKHGIKIPHNLVVKLRSLGQERVFKNHYKIDINRFVDIRLPEVAYFLGYFWADGYIKIQSKEIGHQYIFTMCIVREDYEDIKDELNRIGQWNISIKKKNIIQKRPNDSACVSTYNKPLVIYLTGLDMHKKSHISPSRLLSTIPIHLQHYFWRGFMDGDGSIRVSKTSYVSMAGSFDQNWSDLEDILKFLSIKYRIERRPTPIGGSSQVIFNSLEDIYKWGKYIYKENSDIGLRRKYDRWIQAKQKYERSQEIRHLVFDEPKNLKFTKATLLILIYKYNNKISRKRILGYFNIQTHKFDYMIQKLFSEGLVSRDINIGDKPYYLVNK